MMIMVMSDTHRIFQSIISGMPMPFPGLELFCLLLLSSQQEAFPFQPQALLVELESSSRGFLPCCASESWTEIRRCAGLKTKNAGLADGLQMISVNQI